MVTDEVDPGPAPVIAAPRSHLDGIAAPDPDVADNARSRLASRHPLPGGLAAGQAPHQGDVRAVNSVIDAIHGGNARPADALDAGAALVLLCDLRGYLDRLEADLLDGAQQVDLSWDVIAAILGIPAAEVQLRHADLRARRDCH